MGRESATMYSRAAEDCGGRKADTMKDLLKKKVSEKRDMLWYAVCFALLGLIDQRRGSAEGSIQMIFVNLTGIVIGMLLIPSIKSKFCYSRFFRIWSVICIPGVVIGCIIGRKLWIYPGQWYTAVINVVVIGYLVLYIVWNREEIKERRKLNRGGFFLIVSMLIVMQLSVHEVLWPVWFLFLFGCLYLIGLPEEKEELFMEGMLLGIIVWFFVQQIIAFGFRPYDYMRYRGLYSGETQNGAFYMVVFCAFTGAWLFLKKRKAKIFLRVLCFLLSAGSVGFQLLTGGRSSLLGIVAAAVLAYAAYDILMCNSFRHWIFQGILLGMCIVILMPAVYGCVRYLPTILHHPVWFEGEYYEETSVHSYDPWNSDKYISFEQALENNIGRIMQILRITIFKKDGKVSIRTPMSITAYAAAPGEPGSSPEQPFAPEEMDLNDPVMIRRTIYYYYAAHLNIVGHSKENNGFYVSENIFYDHAHNMFLQIAYDYGIIAGVIFLIWNLWCLIRLLLRRDLQGIICAAFLAAILAYGCFEMAVTTGQITLALLFIIYYFGMRKCQR